MKNSKCVNLLNPLPYCVQTQPKIMAARNRTRFKKFYNHTHVFQEYIYIKPTLKITLF